MALANRQIKDKLQMTMENLMENRISSEVKAAFKEWIENKENNNTTRAVSEKVMETLSGYKADSKEKQKLVDFINERKDYLIKKSIWGRQIGRASCRERV